MVTDKNNFPNFATLISQTVYKTNKKVYLYV